MISGNTVNILPLQSGDSNYITVTSITPPSAELGRSIDIDLSESAKSVIYNAHNYARRNEENVFWNINTFMNNTTVQGNLTVSGNIINTNLDNKLSRTHNSKLAIYNATTKYFKLGTLNLPNGGNHAVINFNACFGYGVAGSINSPSYQIQNYQMTAHIYSSTPATSRQVFVGSLGLNSSRYDDPNNSIYYSGFVVVTSPLVTPLGMFLAPVPSDPTNKVDVWVRSLPWHGQPLIQVVQSEGTFTRATFTPGFYDPPIEADYMPLDGYIQLDMYSHTLTQIYRNVENPDWW